MKKPYGIDSKPLTAAQRERTKEIVVDMFKREAPKGSALLFVLRNKKGRNGNFRRYYSVFVTMTEYHGPRSNHFSITGLISELMGYRFKRHDEFDTLSTTETAASLCLALGKTLYDDEKSFTMKLL